MPNEMTDGVENRFQQQARENHVRKSITIIEAKKNDDTVLVQLIWLPASSDLVIREVSGIDLPLDPQLGKWEGQTSRTLTINNPTATQAMTMWRHIVPQQRFSLKSWIEKMREKLPNTGDCRMIRGEKGE